MESNSLEAKHCLECGKPIYEGRADKKFCGNICRSKYHNKGNSDSNWIIKKIDQQSHLNHEILTKYYPISKGKKGIPLDILITDGFDHKVHFGCPIRINAKIRPLFMYFSYKYKYRYDRENNEITIYEMKTRLNPRQ